MSYDFTTKLQEGESAEAFLDRFFARQFLISPATRAEQRLGVDRWFQCRRTGTRFRVEYKADRTASRTGRAFIETISVDRVGAEKKGWAHTSTADKLIYWLPEDSLAYVIELSALRAKLPSWTKRFPTRLVPNKGYNTHGVIVPLAELEACAEAVIQTDAEVAS